MKFLINKAFILWFVVALSLVLQSCGGGGGSSPAGGDGTGTLELSLTDAADNEYQAVYVTIAEVQVNKQSAADGEGETGWETIMTPGRTYNLLELVNGVTAVLGVGELEAGRYGQMRLILGQLPETPEKNILGEDHPYANYLIDGENNAIELKVPSGYQTGIKIVKGFTIEPSQDTELILDFDAAKSVVQAGKSGKWLLKPTIKVLKTEDKENSVSGVVVDDGTDEPIKGALVSAQVHDPDAADEVIIETTTMTTAEGEYKFYLPRDMYNIVATMDDYLPACQVVDAQYFEELINVNFSLELAAESFTISGTVSGLDSAADESALLSIRRTMDCGSAADVTVEIASSNVAEGGMYSFTLPAGEGITYELVASAAGKITQVEEGINTDTEVNIAFLPVE